MLEVPAVVRSKALALGAGAWVAGLPALVDELAARWSLSVGEVFTDGTEALVVAVDCADGRPAVLKLVMPGLQNAAAHELTVLRLAGGSGCAELLRDDEEGGALLLERLGRPLSALARPFAERQEILVQAASAVWRPAPGSGLPTGAEKARHLAEFIPSSWEAAGRPCSSAAVEQALACAARREAAHDDARAVLVHGDIHQWNALEAPGGGFKLVDPDGLLAEPEYDLGVLLREDPLEGDPHERARWLAARTGLDAVAIADWGVTERVATGLLATRIGLQPVGLEMLAVADRLAV